MSVLINYYITAKRFFKGLGNSDIFAYSALENNRRDDALALAHVVKIVGRDGFAKPGYDILPWMTHLYFMDKVRLGENRTSGGYLSRMFGGKGDLSELLDFHAEAFCLARKK